MIAQDNSPSFLDQIAILAPAVSDLITSKHARVTVAITSHDVTGTYGRGFTFSVKLEILLEQCRSCGETQFSKPAFDCQWHDRSFEKRFMQIADTEAPTLEKALAKLNAAMHIRAERIAA